MRGVGLFVDFANTDVRPTIPCALLVNCHAMRAQIARCLVRHPYRRRVLTRFWDHPAKRAGRTKESTRTGGRHNSPRNRHLSFALLQLKISLVHISLPPVGDSRRWQTSMSPPAMSPITMLPRWLIRRGICHLPHRLQWGGWLKKAHDQSCNPTRHFSVPIKPRNRVLIINRPLCGFLCR